MGSNGPWNDARVDMYIYRVVCSAVSHASVSRRRWTDRGWYVVRGLEAARSRHDESGAGGGVDWEGWKKDDGAAVDQGVCGWVLSI